jgi:hypothetical protein
MTSTVLVQRKSKLAQISATSESMYNVLHMFEYPSYFITGTVCYNETVWELDLLLSTTEKYHFDRRIMGTQNKKGNNALANKMSDLEAAYRYII